MARSSQSGDGDRTRTGVTAAELLSRQRGPTVRHRRQVPGRAALSRPRRRRVLVGVAVLVVAGLGILSVLARQPEPHGIAGDANAHADVLHARQWLDSYAPGLVLTDGGLRTQLLHAGWDPGRVRTAASCTPTACPADWLVSTPALRAGLIGGGPLDSALRASTPVAVFGSGVDRVEIRHPGVRTPEQAASARRARTAVGQALVRVPRVSAGPEVRAVLEGGRADPRVLAMLASLAQRGTVRVLELPAVPGEDEAGQPRRGMLLALDPDEAGQLTQFFAAQSEPYRPLAISKTSADLLVRYPPLAPPNLLDGFEGP